MPFFSVIIPTFNRATILPRALKSILSQSFSDWELIIQDDGSTDDTSAVVKVS
jgi:glycosyltransferase involved in cell wall biosynthesis